ISCVSDGPHPAQSRSGGKGIQAGPVFIVQGGTESPLGLAQGQARQSRSGDRIETAFSAGSLAGRIQLFGDQIVRPDEWMRRGPLPASDMPEPAHRRGWRRDPVRGDLSVLAVPCLGAVASIGSL